MEHLRYFRFFCLDSDFVVYFDDFRSLIKLFNLNISNTKIVVNGLRFPDKALIKLCEYKNWSIIILQHNADIPSYNKIEKLKKVTYNFVKYAHWLVFTLLLVVILMFKPRGSQGKSLCYCFNSTFANAVEKVAFGIKTKIMSPPDMRIYGSVSSMLSSENLTYFFIDEPFEKTLSIPSSTILEAALAMLPDGSLLHVKLHPRSSAEKYDNFKARIKIIDYYPNDVDVLFTYKSNLGQFYRPNKTRFIYIVSEKRFIEDTLGYRVDFNKMRYIEECKVKLQSLR